MADRAKTSKLDQNIVAVKENMRFLIALIIMLSFPALEVYLLVEVYQYIGWWVVVLLAVSALTGMMLIAEERLVFVARMVVTLQNGGSPFRALFESGRNMVAGALFIFPGVISDVLALIILLLPSRWLGRKATNTLPPGVIEGEFRREANREIKHKNQ